MSAIPDDILDIATEIVRRIETKHMWKGYCIADVAQAIQAERERWEDKVDGLSSDLDSAVEVAFNRGATEWVRLNYPKHFTRLMGDERKGE